MIYLLPNIFTTLNIFCGFFAIISIINKNLWHAGWAILFSIMFDIFDGRIARHFQAFSKFGMEYDSLCDLVSFGVAPSLLAYEFVLKDLGNVGWIACFLYTTCVALRLARFNVTTDSGKTYFEGLPSPAGAALIATAVLFFIKSSINLPYKKYFFLTFLTLIAYLLVSSIEYPSFKEIQIKKGQTFYFLLFFVLGLSLASIDPPLSILIIIGTYTLIGPFLFVKTNLKGIRKKKKNFKENLTK
ncbi:MAG: CDP-diacylglycerol--serine O-phosphatidyltransferase [Thermodesulfobacteria bacterium]|nr:CDP-diacylglycerol--serine O-phosphatidyltransferase [Thermodesulfobacteriota bacterium]